MFPKQIKYRKSVPTRSSYHVKLCKHQCVVTSNKATWQVSMKMVS